MTASPPVVLHLISSLRVGGAERLLVSTMQAAAKGGAGDFVVVIMNDECDPGLVAALEATRIPLYRLGRREGHLSPKYLRAILDIADRHAVKIVHTHNEGSRSWGMLAKLFRPQLKLVYTVHAEGVGRSITGLRRTAYLRLVDATVAISRAVEAECNDFGVKNVTRIENGIDLSSFARPTKASPLTQPLRLINVARFQPVKGQDVLIEALALCHAQGRPMPLTLVGAGAHGPFFEGLKAQIARHRLENAVSFAIDRTDIPTLLSDADIFVLPSRQEGFGLALIEAMASGLPVVAARTGGPATLIEHGVNGLTFTPGDAGDLAGQILRLSEDAALRESCVRHGHATAKGYDITATLAAHRALYARLDA